MGNIECDRGGIADRARGAGHRLHGEQHAAHVDMRDDRDRLVRLHAGLAALLALMRILQRLLQCALGNRHALQADRQPRLVHHGEHAHHAGILFADQPACGAALVAIDHGAGGRGMNAELVLQRMHPHVVARAERAVGIHEEFRNEEQRDALGAGRRIGQARQHKMDDVVGEIVLAIGDEDFLAGDLVGAIAGALGFRAQRADIGAGLRLGELHGAHPFAADELRQILFLEVVGAVLRQRVDAGHRQDRPETEGHRRRVPHLDAGGVERARQALTAPLLGRGEAVPAGGGPGRVGLLPARRQDDMAVLQYGAVLVAEPVEGSEDIGRKAAGFLKHRPDIVGAEIAIKARGERLAHAGRVGESEGDILHRRAIAHAFSPGTGNFCSVSGLVQRRRGVNHLPDSAEKLIADADMARVRRAEAGRARSAPRSAEALLTALGRSQVVRQRILIPPFPGSNPGAPARQCAGFGAVSVSPE
jgi:hypothetical protein